MIGVINDPRVAAAVGEIFGGAAADIRARSNESVSAEEHGERATAEPSYTDEFVYQLRTGVARRLELVAAELRERGANVRIEFHATNIRVGDETRFGADIGLRTTLRSDDAALVKGVLFQCKRLYGPASHPSYPEIRGRGEEQAKKMLRVTPASFFMLYNFGTQRQLLNWSSIPTATICPIENTVPIPLAAAGIAEACHVWSESGGGMWDMGIAVLPAARVLSMSAAAAISGNQLPIDAQRILRGCIPFGVFAVDFLAACFVGDMREEVVRLVTPSRLRDELFPRAGLARPTEFEGFAVRHIIDVEITYQSGRALIPG
jgi:hypothetical protein